MGQLLVALGPGAGVDAAAFAAAWNEDKKAIGTGKAEMKSAGPRQFNQGVELVVVPLKANQAPDAVYEVLKGVLKHLRCDSVEATGAFASATSVDDDDVVAVISATPAAADAPAPRPCMVGFTSAVTFVCWLSRMVSPATLLKCYDRESRIHNYVLAWLVTLVVILVFCPISGWLRIPIVVLVFYRLQDLIFSTIDNAFKLTKRGRQPPKYMWQTPLLLALVNIIQIVLIFAIAYLQLTGQNSAAFAHPPSDPFNAFFLSWISLPPLGGGATPMSTMARVLTINEEATGLLIIVIAIGRFLAAPG
jgi:hypothetical protein